MEVRLNETGWNNTIIFGKHSSGKTSAAQKIAKCYLGSDNEHNYTQIYLTSDSSWEEKIAGNPKYSFKSLKLNGTLFTKDTYLNRHGYRPSELKRFIDRARYPKWFDPKAEVNIWYFRMEDELTTNSSSKSEELWTREYCLNTSYIMLRKKESYPNYSIDQPITASNLEKCEYYMTKVLKKGDFILVPENGNDLAKFGIVESDTVSYTKMNENKLYDGRSRGGTTDYIVREVKWYYEAKENNGFFSSFFKDGFLPSCAILPFPCVTTAEILDWIFTTPESIPENERNTQKYALTIFGINETGIYDKLFKWLPTSDDSKKIYQLKESGNVFWIPDNIFIIGIAHSETHGSDIEHMKKHFPVILKEENYANIDNYLMSLSHTAET